ncbi:MAG: TRAP-type mannitol/chloroaromatic compound transport system permease small subunit [Paracoccaceae bacterium]|jgi:TRAP-type mannitol/chloroaromatic compound transport system permease small subunit
MSQAEQISSRYAAAGGNDGADALVRAFGWANIAAVAVLIVETMLIFGKPGLPSPAEAFNGGSIAAWGMLLLYPAAMLFAAWMVLRTPLRGLREDADLITAINRFIIRGAFFAVLFIGFADAVISFLRVEELLDGIVGEELGGQLGLSAFRGPYVHIPLFVLGYVVACFTRTLGFTWLALLIVVAELGIVLTRFIFSYEQAFMGDLVRFWYAALFLFASAYTLVEEGHVRVDVIYAGMSGRTRGWVNALGSVFLGMVLCWVILVLGLGGQSTVVTSAMSNYEISQSQFGMYTKYWMAGYLAVFAATMLIQFAGYFMDAVADLRGQPGSRTHASSAAH